MAIHQGVTIVEGGLDASGLSMAIVVSRFNAFITERLVEGALDALIRHGASASDQTLVRVPGAYELPMLTRRLADSGRYDAVIGLGCLIRGDTIHFDLIAAEVTKGLAQVSMSSAVPVSFGVLTTDGLEQAVHRAGAKYGNKGAEAAMAAVEHVRVVQALDESSTSESSTPATSTKKTTKRARSKKRR